MSAAPVMYPASSLETAACLWEAVLEMEGVDLTLLPKGRANRAEIGERALAIKAARERVGTVGLRLTVIGWTEAVDAAWKAADDPKGTGYGGEYPHAFDWDFVPYWIAENVDWGTVYPSMRSAGGAS